ncbi:hypothetical protein DL768_007804 [Monosporascus sp. mg162]|nr:hypothetical protein DL768_007804 [Monosporascus sp. mg162]
MAPSPTFWSIWTHFHPPKPSFTEKNVPDLQGKVYLVTGSNTGIGKEVARILYAKNAKVYMACRSLEKASNAIRDIENAAPTSKGELVFLALDLADLNSVKSAAETFFSQESKLHVLFNNAGVAVSPVSPPPKTTQGYDLSLGVNCIGTFLFTRLVTPLLVNTSKTSAPSSVRVVWLSSFALEFFGARDTGVDLDNLDYHTAKPAAERYGISKAGVWALGIEFARRHREDGILSVPVNPGNLSSELARDQPAMLRLVSRMVGYPPVLGAYTELFAAFDPQVAEERPGDWVAPFGRFCPLRQDLIKATKLESEGGTAGAYKFWEWTENQVKAYLNVV